MIDGDLPIFVTATMTRVPPAWQPCGAVVKVDGGTEAWLLVAPIWRIAEMQQLINLGV